jgi:hypothetical protein
MFATIPIFKSSLIFRQDKQDGPDKEVAGLNRKCLRHTGRSHTESILQIRFILSQLIAAPAVR